MSYKLVKEIIGGVWSINDHEMHALLPYVHNLLSGGNVNMSDFTSEETIRTVVDPISEQRILIIPIKSIITKYEYCGALGTYEIDQLLRRTDARNEADAVIFDSDSPGGSASYLENLGSTIRNLSIPVVTFYSGSLCSAAYHIGSSSQAIFASTELDTVGSIGTMISFTARNPNQENPEFIDHAIYATESTEKNKDFMEAVAGRYDLLRSKVIDPFNKAFHAHVISGREGIDPSVLKGGTYNSTEAIENGLIDGIKTMDEVIQYTLNLLANPESEKLKFNFKTKTNMKNKSYFDKVSAIVGRSVTSTDELNAEEFEALNASTGNNSGDSSGPVFINSNDLNASVASAVATAMEGVAPAMTAEQITETINSGVATAVASALENRAAAPGANAGAVDGGGDAEVVEAWENPNDPVNQYLDSQL